MKLSKRHLLVLSATALITSQAFSFTYKGSAQVPPQNVTAPDIQSMGFLDDQQIHQLATNFKWESERRPSASGLAGTEDMLSREYVEFRNKLISAQTGVEFYQIIKSYDEKYDSIPASANDLKFIVAKLATWLPFKGIVWRMTPMVHQVLSTQQVLLTTLKNFAEQVKINEPGSHVEAQMLYLSVPTPDLVGKEFRHESDLATFLATDVYASINKAIGRLEKIKMVNVQPNKKETPIVFDAKIRFGENAFNGNYDDVDRFKIVGEAERFATVARFHRRMYNISVVAAYNWNGHLDLRREISRMYGMGIAEASLFDKLPGEDNVYLKGVARKTRVDAIKKYRNLYTLTSNGKNWMQNAYFHLHKSALYLEKTWENIKNDNNNFAAQLDPEIFTARKEQIEMGMMNIKKLVGNYGPGVSGETKITGAISGDEVTVNLKAFYENPPRDLKALLPTVFAQNEDIMGMKKVSGYQSLREARTGSDVMEVTFPNMKPVKFRNYLFGRSVGWNTSAYSVLFPKLQKATEVGDAMRVLNESRGTRMLTSGLTLFIR